MTFEQELLTILNQIPAAIEKAFMDVFVLRHPGHGNQKVHGNRFGTGQAKESLRRLKDDKGAREKYKATSRKRRGVEAKPVRTPGKMGPKTTYGETEFSKPATYSGRKRVIAKRQKNVEGEIWSGDVRLELNESAKGSGQFAIENKWTDYSEGRWGVTKTDSLVGPKPLREAKKISKIILDNAIEGDRVDFASKKVRQALRDAGYPARVD